MSAPTRSIDRRDAAVTAALAGAVVIILGYASGIGLRPENAVSATLPQPTPATVAPMPIGPTPVAVPAPLPVVVAPAAPAVRPAPAAVPTTAAPTHAPPTPSPSSTPTPSAAATCAPGLLDPLVGSLPLVGEVSSLLSGLLGTATTPAAGTTPSPDLLSCTIGAVLGPSCCGSVTGRTASGAR